jgi:hypothetical protein
MDWHYFRVQVKKGECHGQRKERSDGLIEINERDGRAGYFLGKSIRRMRHTQSLA